MALIDDIAESLARDAYALAQELDDDHLVDDVAKSIGSSSPTLEEAYLTAIRYLRAETRARALLDSRRTGSGG